MATRPLGSAWIAVLLISVAMAGPLGFGRPGLAVTDTDPSPDPPPAGLGGQDAWVDAAGDTMNGALVAGAAGLAFPAGAVTGPAGTGSPLLLGGLALCQPGLLLPGCGSAADVTGVGTGNVLVGGGFSGDVQLAMDPSGVQARVSGQCAAASAIRVVRPDGLVDCETDDGTAYTLGAGLGLSSGLLSAVVGSTVQSGEIEDGALQLADLSGGACFAGDLLRQSGSAWTCGSDQTGVEALTRLDAGAGLEGGPVTVSGTIGIAAGGVTSPLVGDGTIQPQDLAFTPALAGATGSPGFARTPLPGYAQLGWVSIAMGADGLGLIATNYQNAILVVHCSNLACSDFTTSSIDEGSASPKMPSVAIGADGLAVIAYDSDDTKLARCVDAACSSATVTPLATGGTYPTVTIGADGWPLVFVAQTASVTAVHCENADCTLRTSTIVAPGTSFSRYPSAGIGGDGLPVVSFSEAVPDTVAGVDNQFLRVAHCDDAACSSASVVTVDSTEGDVLFDLISSTLAIGSDGLPIIIYNRPEPNAIDYRYVLHCSVPDCSTATRTFIGGDTSHGAGITIAPGGSPVLAYRDWGTTAFSIARCLDVACTSRIVNAVATGGYWNTWYFVGGFREVITVGRDGLALFVYQADDGLEVVHVSNVFGIPHHRPR